MTKPDTIEKWAWDEAIEIVSNIDADWTWDNRCVGSELDTKREIALALQSAHARGVNND